ncbi:MAG: polysaccharide biosynthesis C-terminal domain-containing protein, partial [Ferruginibacter sp.]
LIPGILSLSMLFTLTAYYAGRNRIGVNINGALLALIFVVAGDYFLIPKYGINAAAMVSSIGYFVYLLFVLRIFVKEHNVLWSSFFIIKANDFVVLFKKFINRPNPADGV